MKANVILIALLFTFGEVQANAKATESQETVITLTTTDNPDRPVKGDDNGDDAPINYSLTRDVYATLSGKVVTILYEASYSSATVAVTHAATGAVVHSSEESTPACTVINLNGCAAGSYLLEIVTDGTVWSGEFEL